LWNPCLQEPATGSFPGPHESNPHPYRFFNKHFSIIPKFINAKVNILIGLLFFNFYVDESAVALLIKKPRVIVLLGCNMQFMAHKSIKSIIRHKHMFRCAFQK
jgi:hypothetical protein